MARPGLRPRSLARAGGRLRGGKVGCGEAVVAGRDGTRCSCPRRAARPTSPLLARSLVSTIPCPPLHLPRPPPCSTQARARRRARDGGGGWSQVAGASHDLAAKSGSHEKAEPDDRRVPCSTSAASLIFDATYGDPPRSGWFSIMIFRWAALMSALLLISLTPRI